MNYELTDEKGLKLLKSSVGFCKFMKTDKYMWQDFVKSSDLPEGQYCPMPRGKYTIKAYSIDADKLPQVLNTGLYTLKVWFSETDGKILSGYHVKANIKRTL